MKTKIRSLIAAPPGKIFIAADLSQAESWIVAYLSGSERMKRSLLFSDIHSDTAVALFHKDKMICSHMFSGSSDLHSWQSKGKNKYCDHCGIVVIETERFLGKKNNHANGYGQGAQRMSESINKESDKPPYVTVSVAECKDYQAVWHGLYPEVQQVFQQDVKDQLQKNRTLITPYGFKRTFYGYMDDQMYKAAYAFVPQSSVSYHFSGAIQKEVGIRGGLLAVHEDLCNDEIKIINMAHDSLLLELPEYIVDEIAPQVYDRLYRPMVVKGEQFTIPVDLEIGYNYGSMKEWKQE